jgi:hypothetical protein
VLVLLVDEDGFESRDVGMYRKVVIRQVRVYDAAIAGIPGRLLQPS